MTLREVWHEVLAYPAGVREELHKISWADRKRTQELTTLVVLVGLIAVVIIGSLDAVFNQLLSLLIGVK